MPYQWKVLPFGQATASRVFTALTKPILFLCHHKDFHIVICLDDILVLVCSKWADKRACSFLYSLLSAWYWRELWPNSPTYARFPNLLYTAELLCIKQNKNKVWPPYVNSPCHKVAYAGNSISSFNFSHIA